MVHGVGQPAEVAEVTYHGAHTDLVWGRHTGPVTTKVDVVVFAGAMTEGFAADLVSFAQEAVAVLDHLDGVLRIFDDFVGDAYPEFPLDGVEDLQVAVVIGVEHHAEVAIGLDDLRGGKGAVEFVVPEGVVGAVVAGIVALPDGGIGDGHGGAAAVERLEHKVTSLEHGAVERLVTYGVEVPRQVEFVALNAFFFEGVKDRVEGVLAS